MFERPLMLWLLAAAPLIVWAGWRAMDTDYRLAAAVSALMRLLAFAAAVLVLAGAKIPMRGSAQRMALVLALDESRSIAPDQHDWMMRQVSALRRAMDPRDRLGLVAFGRDARLRAPLSEPRILAPEAAAVDGGGTDIAGALITAAGLFSGAYEKRLVLLSDGIETQGDARGEIAPLDEAGVHIYTDAPPPSAQGRVAITSFAAPASVRANSSFSLQIEVESEAPQPTVAGLKLLADGAVVGGRQITLLPGLNRFRLPYRIARSGAYLMQAAITAPAPLVVTNPQAELAISVS